MRGGRKRLEGAKPGRQAAIKKGKFSKEDGWWMKLGKTRRAGTRPKKGNETGEGKKGPSFPMNQGEGDELKPGWKTNPCQQRSINKWEGRYVGQKRAKKRGTGGEPKKTKKKIRLREQELAPLESKRCEGQSSTNLWKELDCWNFQGEERTQGRIYVRKTVKEKTCRKSSIFQKPTRRRSQGGGRFEVVWGRMQQNSQGKKKATRKKVCRAEGEKKETPREGTLKKSVTNLGERGIRPVQIGETGDNTRYHLEKRTSLRQFSKCTRGRVSKKWKLVELPRDEVVRSKKRSRKTYFRIRAEGNSKGGGKKKEGDSPKENPNRWGAIDTYSWLGKLNKSTAWKLITGLRREARRNERAGEEMKKYWMPSKRRGRENVEEISRGG